MNNYIKDNTSYHISAIRSNHPNMSIPDGADLSDIGYYPLESTPRPETTEFQTIQPDGYEEYEPNKWREKWKVIDLDVNETMTQRRAGMVCGALQFRKAIRAIGKMDAVKAYVEQADEITQEAWEYASEFKRLDPFITVGMAALGVTDTEVDAVFELAKTF